MDIYILLPMVVVIAGLTFFAGWYLNGRSGQNKITSAEERAKRIIEEAEKDAGTLKREKLLEAKDEWYKRKKEFEAEAQSKRNKLQALEKQLISREENVDRKLDLLSKKESNLQSLGLELGEKNKRSDEREKELAKLVDEENTRLERLSGVSRDEAKRQLTENLIESAKSEAAQLLKEVRDKAKEEARKEAQKLIVQAIQRTAADHTVETTVSVLNLESDEMKGSSAVKEGTSGRSRLLRVWML
jgi:ribonuclease Y